LRSAGLEIGEAEFAEALAQVLMVTQRPDSVDPATYLDQDQIDLLESAGLDMRPLGPQEIDRQFAAATSGQAALLAASLTVKEAAQLLNVDSEALLRQIDERELLAFRWQEDLRVPDFQFEDGGVVEGLADVFRCIPQGVEPLTLWRWFVEPNDALDEIDPISPVDWLRSGGDESRLCDLAATLLVV